MYLRHGSRTALQTVNFLTLHRLHLCEFPLSYSTGEAEAREFLGCTCIKLVKACAELDRGIRGDRERTGRGHKR